MWGIKKWTTFTEEIMKCRTLPMTQLHHSRKKPKKPSGSIMRQCLLNWKKVWNVWNVQESNIRKMYIFNRRSEYGNHIEVGENFYANTHCVMLDVGKITIGNNVLFGPNVGIYTAGHPIHPESRNSAFEYGISIAIGDNVWIGGSCCVLPGVKIGNNVVIGAGSVVTKDIPDNVCAAGNPCRVIREITDADRPYYFKDCKFDEAWTKINEK